MVVASSSFGIKDATTRTKLTGSVQAATISELDGATYRAGRVKRFTTESEAWAFLARCRPELGNFGFDVVDQAVEILKERLPKIEELADQLLKQRRIAALG
jgi:hypothetical protein